jgi:hypothetical protein
MREGRMTKDRLENRGKVRKKMKKIYCCLIKIK